MAPIDPVAVLRRAAAFSGSAYPAYLRGLENGTGYRAVDRPRAQPTIQAKQNRSSTEASAQAREPLAQLSATGRELLQGGPEEELSRASDLLIQRTLAEDLQSGTVTTAIAGETHDEIPSSIEKKAWKSRGIKVIYEAAALPGSKKRPDPPILRVAGGWIMLRQIAEQFWKLVEADIDIRGAAGVLAEHRTLVRIIKNSLDDIRLADRRQLTAEELLDGLCQGLPVDEDELMKRPRSHQQYLAETKLTILASLDAVMRSIHGDSSFKEVAFNEDSLQTARSRMMLKTINSAKPPKTIYKVGDLHVDDMKREKMKKDNDVAVMSREDYLVEYDSADIDLSIGGKAIFNRIGDEML